MKTLALLVTSFLLALFGFAAAAHAAGPPDIPGGVQVVLLNTTSAVVSIVMHPNGAPATVFFEWGPTTNYGNISAGLTVDGVFQTVQSPSITGLEPAAQFHVRAFATNIYGTTYTTDRAITTYGPPTAQTLPPTNVTTSSVTFRGVANPAPTAPAPAYAYFDYGFDVGGGYSTTLTETLNGGTNGVRLTATISNLSSFRKYWCRMVVTTQGPIGWVNNYGAALTFFTGAGVPIVQTTPATGVTAQNAALHATVNPNGLAVDVAFQWGLTTNYGNITAFQNFPTDTNNASVTTLLGQLSPDTTYHVRAIATNGMGVTFGNDVWFTTVSTNPPVATTLPPSGITTGAATLHGSVQTYGVPTSAYFQWGTTTNYGFTTPVQGVGPAATPIALQTSLASLAADVVYHYRLVASNAAGFAYGDDVLATPTSLLYLYAGDSWSYEFHDLPYVGLIPWNQTLGQASCFLDILPGSFAPGSKLRFEIFSGSPVESEGGAIIMPGTSLGNGAFGNYWSDGQGAVRLTMLTGSVVVTSITFDQIGDRSFGFAPHYRNGIVATKFPQPPALGTQFVASVSTEATTINADINANNLPTIAWVEWGATTNYGATVVVYNLNLDYFVRCSLTLSNLAPQTIYHARVVATNGAGVTYGHDLPFITGIDAPLLTSVQKQSGSQVMIHATGTPGASYTLEHSTTLSNWVVVTNLTALPDGTIHALQNATNLGGNYFRFRWP